ncbi:alpha/beta fold hydrolase [Bradyrhizobium sp. RDM4]|uniref:alpha/beta fold hydrolase n=1 Tax=Bradyrhizobium sp. RDM4 TaxID=3378765 RepID=UPI0038FC17AD
MLFIHGFMDAGAVWEPVISALDAHLQKVTIDLPGMGGLSGFDGEISLRNYAAGVERLIQEIGKPVVIVGQSMGAQVGELAALMNPKLVAGLVLITPVPLRGVNALPEAVAPFKQLGGEPALQRQARRSLSHSLSAEAEALLGEFGDMVRPAIVAALVDAWNSGDPDGIQPSAFSGSVLIIRGASDPLVTRDMANAVTARFNRVRSETVPDAGHWAHVEQPKHVAALIDDYLKGVEWSSASPGAAADWKGAFAQRSATAFADAFAEDVVLEATVLYRPVSGRENVKRVMEAASKIYESLDFTDQAADGLRQYIEWKARAFGRVALDGVTIITRNEAGAISRMAIHHRPLGGALLFSTEIGQRLQGVLDASYFLAAESPPRTSRS